MNGSAAGPKGSRDSLIWLVIASWIRSGDRLTTYLEHYCNSYYGATGSPFFSLYSKYLAQATTLTGQCLIRTVSEHISKFIDISIGAKNPDPNKYTIAGDTDSGYFELFPIYEHFVLNKGKQFDADKRTDFYDTVCKAIEEKAIEPTKSE